MSNESTKSDVGSKLHNMETSETYLNRSGLKVEPTNNISPWSTGHGPCPEREPLDLHGSPYRRRPERRF